MNHNDRARQPLPSRRQLLNSAAAAGLALLFRSPSAARADELAPPKFLLEWGERGKGDGEFSACVGIAIGKDDEVFTAEFRNQRVQRFTSEGKFLASFPVQPHAGGLAVDAAGNVYVAHWNSNKVAAYSPTGELLREWGQKGTGDGEFQLPGSIALGPDGLLYVPDQGNSRVQKFTTHGRFVGKWGEHGKEPGQFGGSVPPGGRFSGPQFVAFDRAGNVYATDAALDRVQKFTPDGGFAPKTGTGSERLAGISDKFNRSRGACPPFWGKAPRASRWPSGAATAPSPAASARPLWEKTVTRRREARSRSASIARTASGSAPPTTACSNSATKENFCAASAARGATPANSTSPTAWPSTVAAASTSPTP